MAVRLEQIEKEFGKDVVEKINRARKSAVQPVQTELDVSIEKIKEEAEQQGMNSVRVSHADKGKLQEVQRIPLTNRIYSNIPLTPNKNKESPLDNFNSRNSGYGGLPSVASFRAQREREEKQSKLSNRFLINYKFNESRQLDTDT